MTYPHTLMVREIPVPSKTLEVIITTDHATHKTNHKFFAEPEEFLQFWKPLVDYYEEVKHANSIC